MSIWSFFLYNTACLSITYISEIFSLFQFAKFNISRLDWRILVLAILWSLWLNRNSVIFWNYGWNLSTILFQILHFSSIWTDNLLTGHALAASSVSYAIQQMQQEWDQFQAVQPIPSSAGLNAEEVLATRPGAAESDLVLLAPPLNDSGAWSSLSTCLFMWGFLFPAIFLYGWFGIVYLKLLMILVLIHPKFCIDHLCTELYIILFTWWWHT